MLRLTSNMDGPTSLIDWNREGRTHIRLAACKRILSPIRRFALCKRHFRRLALCKRLLDVSLCVNVIQYISLCANVKSSLNCNNLINTSLRNVDQQIGWGGVWQYSFGLAILIIQAHSRHMAGNLTTPNGHESVFDNVPCTGS